MCIWRGKIGILAIDNRHTLLPFGMLKINQVVIWLSDYFILVKKQWLLSFSSISTQTSKAMRVIYFGRSGKDMRLLAGIVCPECE